MAKIQRSKNQGNILLIITSNNLPKDFFFLPSNLDLDAIIPEGEIL